MTPRQRRRKGIIPVFGDLKNCHLKSILAGVGTIEKSTNQQSSLYVDFLQVVYVCVEAPQTRKHGMVLMVFSRCILQGYPITIIFGINNLRLSLNVTLCNQASLWLVSYRNNILLALPQVLGGADLFDSSEKFPNSLFNHLFNHLFNQYNAPHGRHTAWRGKVFFLFQTFHVPCDLFMHFGTGGAPGQRSERPTGCRLQKQPPPLPFSLSFSNGQCDFPCAVLDRE